MKLKGVPRVILFFQLLAATIWAADESVMSLWPGPAPGSEGKTAEEVVRLSPEGEHIFTSIHHPSLIVVLPSKEQATGAAVVICPGGAHRELWLDHEGYNVARWLAAHGIAGIIVKYRLAQEEGSTYQVGLHSLADVQRAIQTVRNHAVEWGVDPKRVGVIGFSAGGELAALASLHFTKGDPASADAVNRQSSKPDFQALFYPGNANGIVPVKSSPPAFLACGYDDRPDISEELARVYLRFKAVGVPAELHIYTGAGHGFGLRDSNHFPAGAWPVRLREWLADRGFLGSAR
jgi:endo-1,4-beta-xylanase